MPGKDLSRFNRSLTFTNVVIGNGYIFNGNDEKIDCGADFIGTTAITAMLWVKANTIGEIAGRMIDNGRFSLYIPSANRIELNSDGTTSALSAVSSFPYAQWNHLAVTRTSTGVANIYINGVLSGTANQSSGTPAAGTTNVIIGNNNAQSRTFDGTISDLRVFNEIKSAQFIRNYYLKSRNNY